jgi:anti-anti-sigma factor
MAKDQNGVPKVMQLSGSLNVDRASGLQKELSSALGEADHVLVDLSGVEEIDLSALQILYAARRSAAAAGKEFHLIGSIPSKAVKRLVACGFLHGSPVRAEEVESGLVDF